MPRDVRARNHPELRSTQGDRGSAVSGEVSCARHRVGESLGSHGETRYSSSPVTRLRPVFLARHGQTDWNAAGRWQGHTDVPLNETGRAQARALAERLRGEGIAAIASSDLARARGTAEIVAAVLGLRVDLLDPDLRERRFGIFEGLTLRECEQRHPEDWARYAGDPGLGPPLGESRSALLERL